MKKEINNHIRHKYPFKSVGLFDLFLVIFGSIILIYYFFDLLSSGRASSIICNFKFSIIWIIILIIIIVIPAFVLFSSVGYLGTVIKSMTYGPRFILIDNDSMTVPGIFSRNYDRLMFDRIKSVKLERRRKGYSNLIIFTIDVQYRISEASVKRSDLQEIEENLKRIIANQDRLFPDRVVQWVSE